MSERSHIAKLFQDGIVVASVSGPDKARLEREIMHYAEVYLQDGPVEVQIPGRARRIKMATSYSQPDRKVGNEGEKA